MKINKFKKIKFLYKKLKLLKIFFLIDFDFFKFKKINNQNFKVLKIKNSFIKFFFNLNNYTKYINGNFYILICNKLNKTLLMNTLRKLKFYYIIIFKLNKHIYVNNQLINLFSFNFKIEFKNIFNLIKKFLFSKLIFFLIVFSK